jgi:hypothetical protein
MNELREANSVRITPLLAARVVKEYLLPLYKGGGGGKHVTHKSVMKGSAAGSSLSGRKSLSLTRHSVSVNPVERQRHETPSFEKILNISPTAVGKSRNGSPD